MIAPFHTHSRHGRSTTANTARACTTFFQSWAEQTHYLHKVLHGALVVCWSHGKLITNSAFLFGCSFFSNTFILVRFVLVSQPYRWDLLSYPIRDLSCSLTALCCYRNLCFSRPTPNSPTKASLSHLGFFLASSCRGTSQFSKVCALFRQKYMSLGVLDGRTFSDSDWLCTCDTKWDKKITQYPGFLPQTYTSHLTVRKGSTKTKL